MAHAAKNYQSNTRTLQLSTARKCTSPECHAHGSVLTRTRAAAYSPPFPVTHILLFSQELFGSRGSCHEKNLPTQQSASQAHAWLSRTYGHGERTQGSCQPPRQRSRSSDSVTDSGLSRHCSRPPQGSHPSSAYTAHPSSAEYSPSPLAPRIAISLFSADRAAAPLRVSA